jgi:hypothetical protein
MFFSHNWLGRPRGFVLSAIGRLRFVYPSHDCFRMLARLTAVLTRTKDFGWNQ